MKKYIVIFLIVFLLTGCRSVANISIDKNVVTEEVTIRTDNASNYEAYKNWKGFPLPLYFDQELDDPMWLPNRKKESGVSYYSVSPADNNNVLKVSGKFKLKEHTRSSLVRNCFQFYNIIDEGDKTIFSTSKGLTCAFNNFSIVVSTPYLVISNNANSVDEANNRFTWNVNSSNAKNFGIYLEIDFSKKYKDDSNSNADNTDKDNKESKIYAYLAIPIVIILITLSAMYLHKKKDNLSK